MRKTKQLKNRQKRKCYLPPECVELSLDLLPLLSNSPIDERDDYGEGGDPFSQGDVGGSDGNSSDPFSQGNTGGNAKVYVGDWDIWIDKYISL